MKLSVRVINSPVGKLTLVATPEALVQVYWGRMKSAGSEDPNHAVLNHAEDQLREYFEGKRTTFDVPTKAIGTKFQMKVWKALTEIPYGKTASYSEIARKIRNPRACRAVGNANNKNPLSIIVPCHRVIGSDGDLTGFGGGINAKRLLLSIESGARSSLS